MLRPQLVQALMDPNNKSFKAETSLWSNSSLYFTNETVHFTTESAENKTTLPLIRETIIVRRIVTWLYAVASLCLAWSLTVVRCRRCKTGGAGKDHNNYGATLNFFRLLTAHFVAVSFVYHSFSWLLEDALEIKCEWYVKTEIVLYWTNIALVYQVLWLRQRAIYGKPTLRHLTTRTTVRLSNFVGFLTFAFPVINSLIFALGTTSQHLDGICQLDEVLWDEVLLMATEFVVPIVLPLTLVGLFIWPLIRHHRNADCKANYVIPTIWKILLLTVGCLTTDMIAMACNTHCNGMGSFIGRQTSIFFNLLFLNLSFSDWRSVMIPCMKQAKRKRRSTVVRASWDASYHNVWTTEEARDVSRGSFYSKGHVLSAQQKIRTIPRDLR